MSAGDAFICLGAFAGAHGVRGETRVKTFTAAPEDVAAYGPLKTETGARQFTLKIVRVLGPDLVIARAPEIASREDAQALAGTRLYAPRAALPALEDEDEFYIEDLIGLAAFDETGAPQGRVAALHNFGAGDLLELKERPGGARAIIIAFTKAAVPAIDLAAGRITVAAAALAPDDAGPVLSDETGDLVSDDRDVALAAMREEDS